MGPSRRKVEQEKRVGGSRKGAIQENGTSFRLPGGARQWQGTLTEVGPAPLPGASRDRKNTVQDHSKPAPGPPGRKTPLRTGQNQLDVDPTWTQGVLRGSFLLLFVAFYYFSTTFWTHWKEVPAIAVCFGSQGSQRWTKRGPDVDPTWTQGVLRGSFLLHVMFLSLFMFHVQFMLIIKLVMLFLSNNPQHPANNPQHKAVQMQPKRVPNVSPTCPTRAPNVLHQKRP